MEVKQEPFDEHKQFVKIEPDLVSNDSLPSKQMSVLDEPEPLVNVEIKQETMECVVPKLDQCSDLPVKIDNDSVEENVHIFNKTIKNELEDIQEVEATDMFVDIDNIKQEVCDYEHEQPKTENELLNTDCDLPTLKSESIDSSNYFVQPISSEHPTSSSKTASGVFKKKKKMYPCPVCQKSKLNCYLLISFEKSKCIPPP